MDSFEILKSKQNFPEWKAGGLLSLNDKLPQGLSLIAAIRRNSDIRYVEICEIC